MSAGDYEPLDVVLDAFIAAWFTGMAPEAGGYLPRVAPGEREELERLLAAFLQLAPTVEPRPARAAELSADPLVARLAEAETERWEAAGELARAAAQAAAGDEAPGDQEAPFGARLRALREAAGLSIGALGHAFAARFALAGDDADAAPEALRRLESGDLAAAGVASRAARALEELLQAPRGTLTPAGAVPGSALLRSALPDEDAERGRFSDLLREVDDALTAHAPDTPPGETLRSLLGA